MCYSTCAESEIVCLTSIFVVVCCCFLLLYHVYRLLSSVCYMFFESFFEKVFRRVVMFDTPLGWGCWHGCFRVWGRVFLLGLRPWVFASRHPSMACGGLLRVVGVLVWGGACLLVTGAARGVAGFTLVWLALGCGVCIMKGARFKGKPRQRGGGRVRGRRPRES